MPYIYLIIGAGIGAFVVGFVEWSRETRIVKRRVGTLVTYERSDR